MSGAAEFELNVPASSRGVPMPGPDGRPWCSDYGITCGTGGTGGLWCPWCPNDRRPAYVPSRGEKFLRGIGRFVGYR